jgi:hypothetical protein
MPIKALQDKVYKSINDIVGKSQTVFWKQVYEERRENPFRIWN